MTTPIAFLDRCIFKASGLGLGDFVVASASPGYLTPDQANAVDGQVYHAVAQSTDTAGNILQWEISTGAYTFATKTQARTTVLFSSSSNAKVSFVTVPNVFITVLAEDMMIGPTTSVANDAVVFSDTGGRVLIDSKVKLTSPATGATLTLADGKTLTVNKTLTLDGTDGKTLKLDNTLELQGTDSSIVNFGTGGTVLYNDPFLLPKTTPAVAGPGAGLCRLQAVAGTIAGTCKIIVFAGTSATPITLIDNVGAGF